MHMETLVEGQFALHLQNNQVIFGHADSYCFDKLIEQGYLLSSINTIKHTQLHIYTSGGGPNMGQTD